jgi:fucose 4-O-acetylase-like acetyltransferase
MMIKRDLFIDIAKGLCIILVVMGIYFNIIPFLEMNQPIFNFIYSFHMPEYIYV